MNRLGPYDLLGVLGRGGMGTVYRAKHRETGDQVAVKALAQNHNEDGHFRQRFESEIQALLKLDHPNIVRLLGYGQEDGALYFAMELVEGQSLFHLQREIKSFDWRDVLVICRDVAQGLRHAHDRGIVHRDLKPGNLLKSHDGLIKITDFGIAKAYGVSHDTRDNVVGTIDFMSPEQALGRPVTARSDLYSLGVVLYTLLAGQPPFASSSIEQSLRNLTRVPAPKIRSRVPSVPDALEEVIDELLEKKPENRTPTAYALLRKLDYVEQILRDGSEAATSHGQAKPASTTKPGILKPEATFRLGKPASDEGDGPARPGPAETPTGLEPVTHRNGNPAKNRPARKRSDPTIASRETVVQSDLPGGRELLEPPPKMDFFNPVTETERKRVFQPDPETTASAGSRGWFSILFLFLLVVAMTCYGILQAYRVESATVLYERIAESADKPYYVLDDIRAFLLNYPSDVRADRVRQLNDIALAMQKFKLLSTKVRLPGDRGPSLLEREFVTVIEAAESDPASGIAKLEAFITLHDARDETPDATMELVSAAKYYLEKIRSDSAFQQTQDRNAAISALMRARASPSEAADIYKSIIQIYKGKDWVREQVDQAESELERIRRAGESGSGNG